MPPFAGGAVGLFGYDLVRTVEPLGPPNDDPLGLPDLALMITDVMVIFDHLHNQTTIMACAFAEDGGIDVVGIRLHIGSAARRPGMSRITLRRWGSALARLELPAD